MPVVINEMEMQAPADPSPSATATAAEAAPQAPPASAAFPVHQQVQSSRVLHQRRARLLAD